MEAVAIKVRRSGRVPWSLWAWHQVDCTYKLPCNSVCFILENRRITRSVWVCDSGITGAPPAGSDLGRGWPCSQEPPPHVTYGLEPRPRTRQTAFLQASPSALQRGTALAHMRSELSPHPTAITAVGDPGNCCQVGFVQSRTSPTRLIIRCWYGAVLR